MPPRGMRRGGSTWYSWYCAPGGPTGNLVDVGGGVGGFGWEKVPTLNVVSVAAGAVQAGHNQAPTHLGPLEHLTGMRSRISGASPNSNAKMAFLLPLGRSFSVEMEPRGASVAALFPGATLTHIVCLMANAALLNSLRASS